MKQQSLVMGLVGLGVFALVAFGLWYWVLGPTQGASGPLVAATLAPPQNTAAAPTATALMAATATTTSSGSTPVAPIDPTALPTAPPSAGGFQVFVISQAESEVAFNIFEELRGAPKDVIGTTNQVAGEIGFDSADLSTAQIGAITINARTFATDDSQRDRAIRNRILNTDQYEFITFTPSEIRNLTGAATVGQAFTFQIAGDLTIRNVTQPVVFDVTAQMETPTRLTGQATTTIQRTPYNLLIPSVPSVANVGEDVVLTLTFVAEEK